MTSGQAPGRAEPYIPNGGRAKAVVAAFWANIAVQVVLAALTAFQIHLLTDIVAGRPVPQAVLEASDARMQVAAGLDLGVFVVTGVLFLT